MRSPTHLGFCLVLLPVAALANPQLAPIGLSEVRAQWFDNESLDFYGPDAQDHFAAALASGDFNGDGAADLATGIPDDEDIDSGAENLRQGLLKLGQCRYPIRELVDSRKDLGDNARAAHRFRVHAHDDQTFG